MTRTTPALLPALLVVLAAGPARAQAPVTGPAQTPAASLYLTPIGPSIHVEAARRVATAALAEARKNGWLMAVAVVDPAGTLVFYEKMDDVQLGSATASVQKARSAALFKRPTKTMQDTLAAGGAGLRILKLEGAMPLEGGLPILQGGKLIGAIGLSGDLSENDGKCAAAGVAALKE